MQGVRDVNLVQELQRPRVGPGLTLGENGWETDLDVTGVDRLEYLFAVTDDTGETRMITDPDNSRTVSGPFGPKSEFLLPGYQEPSWLGYPRQGRVRRVTEADTAWDVGVWSPPRIRRTTALPLLVVHDGPEYAEYSRLLDFCWWAIAEAGVGPFRVALLQPTHRTPEYSADPDYATRLGDEIIPAVIDTFNTRSQLGMGASLGGLAMLHHHTVRKGFDGLFLQSGAFFRPDLDLVEKDFETFRTIAGFVDGLLTGRHTPAPVPTTMTCGVVEENLANNRLVQQQLTRQGWDIAVIEHRDAHNWVSWRDTFEGALLPLMRRIWQ